MNRIGAQTVAFGLMCVMSSAHAVMTETYPVQLNSRDTSAVTSAACRRNAHAAPENLRAFRHVEQSGAPIYVSVVCAARRTETAQVFRSRAECDNEEGRWRCNDLGDFLEVNVGRKTVEVATSGPAGKNAGDIARFLLTIDSYDGLPLSQRIDGATCFVSSAPLDVWDVRCDNISVLVAQDCANGTCTYRAFGNPTFWVE